MEIINSNKNHSKLCFESYMYHYVLKHTEKNIITWRFCKLSMLECPGSIYTVIEKSKIIKFGKPHIIPNCIEN